MKNKKLIASLTLAGFMATSFVPAAGLGLNVAYAAAADVSVSASYLETADKNPEVDTNEAVEVKLGLLDRNNQAVAINNEGKSVVIWAESTSGRADDALVYVANSVEKATAMQDGSFIKVPAIEAAEAKLQVKFTRSGSYTLHAALVDDAWIEKLNNGEKKISDIRNFELTTISDKKTIKVAAKTSVDKIVVNGKEINENTVPKKPIVKVNKDNGIEAAKVDLVVKNGDSTVGRGVKVTLDTNSNNIQLDKKEYVTGNGGAIEFKVTGTNQGEYKIYATVEGKEFIILVEVSNENRIDNIVNTKLPSAPISVDSASASKKLEDVRFEFRDRNGNVIKNAQNLPILNPSDSGYVKVVEKPAKSKVEAKDFSLVEEKDNEGNGKGSFMVKTEKDLVAGKYVVRFAIDNGKAAEASFEVAEFGKVTALKLEYDTETVELGKKVDAPSIKFVDEKGVEKEAKGVNLGYSGYAVETAEGKTFDYSTGAFTVKNDEKYLGTKIVVTAVSDRQNLVAVAELSVAQDGRGLKFATNSGVINVNNTVEFKIVDGSGKSVAIESVGSVDAIVLSSSNKDAVVSTNINTGDIEATKGEGKLRVTSNKPTTAEIQVFIRDKNRKYYAGTLTYTFGETALNANVNRFVVMSINNEVANVNNVNVKLDASPIVKMNRTFVPFRAVAEAFGAEVGYDEKTKKVTTKLDGKTLELTLGSKKLMVNGQEKTMDVEPFAMNSRTMVPVRFVAEELGFKVSAVRDAKKGGTAAVVFSR